MSTVARTFASRGDNTAARQQQMLAKLQTAGDEDDAAAQDRVRVSFFTNGTEFVTDSASDVAIPRLVTPEGLNAFLNAELGTDAEPVPFDFLVGDDFISITLDRTLRKRRAAGAQDNEEAVVMVEYRPSLRAREGKRLPHDDWVACVAAPSALAQGLVATGAYDHCVRVWAGDDCIAVGAAHTEAVKAIAVNPTTIVHPADPTPVEGASRKRRQRGGEQLPSFELASVSKDGTLGIWAFEATPAAGADGKAHTSTGAAGPRLVLRARAAAHTDGADAVSIAPTGDLVATGSFDRTVKVFRWRSLFSAENATASGDAAATVAPLYSLSDHARPVLATRFSAVQEGALLFSAGLDGNVKAWDLAEGRLAATFDGPGHAIHCISTRPAPTGGASDLVLAGHTDGRLRVFDPRQKRAAMTRAWTGHRQWVYTADWLWRADDVAPGTTAPIGGSSEHQEPSTALLGSSSHLFVSGSEDASVRVWDLRTAGAPLLTLDRLHTDGVLGLAYAGQRRIASGGKDNRTRTADLSSPQEKA